MDREEQVKEHILDFKRKYTVELGRTATEYLEVALDLFHKFHDSEGTGKESAVGNLSTAAELLLKTYLCHKNFGLIFKDIPVDRKTLLLCPEEIPDFFEWRTFDFGFSNENNNTISLPECISCYYVFFPHMKQLLMPHLNRMVHWSHASKHSILPRFEGHGFDGFGFAALHMYMSLIEDQTFQYTWYDLSDRDRKFLKSFELMREERVNTALEEAGMKAGSIDFDEELILPTGWDAYQAVCPACKSMGTLKGFTELAITDEGEGRIATLDFFAVSFKCHICGLVLNDVEELKLAKMSTLYDRTDEIKHWFSEHEFFTDWYLE